MMDRMCAGIDNSKKGKMNNTTEISKEYYLVPPYASMSGTGFRSQWHLLNGHGELVAVFEDESDAKHIYNLIRENQ
jgi:hypothetical protein